MISIENISKTFYDRKRGEIKAVLPTTFEINKGEIFGLLGPNGAGKTTLLRMLSTVITPTSGSAMTNIRFGYD
jgi:sodium transport system ATP-binding protein